MDKDYSDKMNSLVKWHTNMQNTHSLKTNCPKSLSTSSHTLWMIIHQETVKHCLLFILRPIYLHKLSINKTKIIIVIRIGNYKLKAFLKKISLDCTLKEPMFLQAYLWTDGKCFLTTSNSLDAMEKGLLINSSYMLYPSSQIWFKTLQK